MQTIKLPYKTDNDIESSNIIFNYMKQYSSCLHFMYNRINKDNLSETEIKHLPINNINLLDSWFKQSCVKEASQIYKTNKDNKLIFGGKKNYFDRIKGNITSDEFKLNKLSPIYSIGEGSNPGVRSNRKFQISSDIKTIVFQPNRSNKIKLELPSLRNNYNNILKKLYILQENKQTSITYKLDSKYIYIMFDESILKEHDIDYKSISNRVMAIDLNPNYIGFSIVDWKSDGNEFNVVKSGVISIKNINDYDFKLKSLKINSSDTKRVYINNKREFETLQISKELINLAIHYKCGLFSTEDLNIKSKDNKIGSKYNKLVNNNWLRNKLVNNLSKRCNIFNIKFIKVKPEYSSFVGNFLYRYLNLPDMVLSSIELSRRGYEYYNQYIIKTKEIKKNIILPSVEFYKELIIKSLEEFNINFKFDTLYELYAYFKNSKIKYRVSLDSLNLKFSSQNNLKYQLIYI